MVEYLFQKLHLDRVVAMTRFRKEQIIKSLFRSKKKIEIEYFNQYMHFQYKTFLKNV